jgi:hypothetical protein
MRRETIAHCFIQFVLFTKYYYGDKIKDQGHEINEICVENFDQKTSSETVPRTRRWKEVLKRIMKSEREVLGELN